MTATDYRELVSEYRALRAEITRLQSEWARLERDEMPSLLAAMREMQAAQDQKARELETHLGFAERGEARLEESDAEGEARASTAMRSFGAWFFSVGAGGAIGLVVANLLLYAVGEAGAENLMWALLAGCFGLLMAGVLIVAIAEALKPER